MSLSINKILWFAIESKASDIHMTVWKRIIFRIEWKLKLIDSVWELDAQSMKEFTNELLCNNEISIKKLNEWHDLDFAYMHDSWTSFRVNGFYKLWKISFILRLINWKVKSIQELWLPRKTESFTKLKQWLILVTWPTWSWKSTTMISILNEINKNRWEHILTIEDPVEYIFKDEKSIFSQREIWRDTDSFKNALRSAVREDPDIIVIWEIRDAETVKAALDLAETGHLVISTLHTSGSAQTITRLVNFFPLDHQHSVRAKIADNLEWVISQRLIQKKDWSWRVWIFELMLINTAIKNIIRLWKLEQIQSNIEIASKAWMITMQNYAKFLDSKWIINKKDYEHYFEEE